MSFLLLLLLLLPFSLANTDLILHIWVSSLIFEWRFYYRLTVAFLYANSCWYCGVKIFQKTRLIWIPSWISVCCEASKASPLSQRQLHQRWRNRALRVCVVAFACSHLFIESNLLTYPVYISWYFRATQRRKSNVHTQYSRAISDPDILVCLLALRKEFCVRACVREPLMYIIYLWIGIDFDIRIIILYVCVLSFTSNTPLFVPARMAFIRQ